jgi:hypothetical protein
MLIFNGFVTAMDRTCCVYITALISCTAITALISRVCCSSHVVVTATVIYVATRALSEVANALLKAAVKTAVEATVEAVLALDMSSAIIPPQYRKGMQYLRRGRGGHGRSMLLWLSIHLIARHTHTFLRLFVATHESSPSFSRLPHTYT